MSPAVSATGFWRSLLCVTEVSGVSRSSQRAYEVPVTNFWGQRVSGVSATRYWETDRRGTYNKVRKKGGVAKFQNGSSKLATSDFRCICGWFSGLHAVFFRVLISTNLLKGKWVLSGGTRMMEGVSTVNLVTLRKRKCVTRQNVFPRVEKRALVDVFRKYRERISRRSFLKNVMRGRDSHKQHPRNGELNYRAIWDPGVVSGRCWRQVPGDRMRKLAGKGTRTLFWPQVYRQKIWRRARIFSFLHGSSEGYVPATGPDFRGGKLTPSWYATTPAPINHQTRRWGLLFPPELLPW